MNEYSKLRLESRTLHDKMQLLIDLQADITDFEYTKANEVFKLINSKLDQLLLASKMIRTEMEIVIND